ncbi:hypothetical protein DLM77_20845 [Leptospira yasudae]|uniref:Uncharacterized protein n=1 Tax=Leptospira yasudae TaxID=2202201 RepID=A0ABX9LYD4_9LEPT|nr:hypothetical protein DLM77_20845 [Leptospira yasudae]
MDIVLISGRVSGKEACCNGRFYRTFSETFRSCFPENGLSAPVNKLKDNNVTVSSILYLNLLTTPPSLPREIFCNSYKLLVNLETSMTFGFVTHSLSS